MQINKIILTGKEARSELKKGVDKVADIVGKTLGPSGRNVMLGTMGVKAPQITNDGISIAKEIILDDETQNLGAEAIINASSKTNDRAGDGTTTTVVIAREIIEEGLKKIDDEHSFISSSINVMDIYREINVTKRELIKKLEKLAKPISTKEDIKKIAVTAVEDEEVGGIIAEMLFKLGKEGKITVESAFDTKISHDVVKGMKVHGTYASDLLANKRKEIVKKEVAIIVTNEDIDYPSQLEAVVNQAKSQGIVEIVLVAPRFAPSVLPTINYNAMQGIFSFIPVKVAALTDSQLEDMAIYTKATFIDKNQAMKLHDFTLAQLGKCEKIIIDESEVSIIGGKGDVKERVKDLKAEMEVEKTDHYKDKLATRIASLSSGIGVIRVGGDTDMERNYKRLKIDDAVYATKCAMEEGVVAGGGVVLRDLAKDLDDESILKKALCKPYEQIQENAGGKLKIGKDILDPVKVTRIALENACSVAGILLTTETTIADKKIPELTESFKKAIDEVTMEQNN